MERQQRFVWENEETDKFSNKTVQIFLNLLISTTPYVFSVFHGVFFVFVSGNNFGTSINT